MRRATDAWPRLMRPPIAEEYAGGITNLERLFTFGLRPSRQAKSNTVYLRDEVDKAIDIAHLSKWIPEPATAPKPPKKK